MFGDDDLIYSGSGCFDDEDKCTGFTEVSSDDLITPVYIPPKGKLSGDESSVITADSLNNCNYFWRVPFGWSVELHLRRDEFP